MNVPEIPGRIGAMAQKLLEIIRKMSESELAGLRNKQEKKEGAMKDNIQAQAVRSSAHKLLPMAVFLSPSVMYAEPRTSMSHMPVMWLIAVIGAILIAIIPLLLRKLIKPRCGVWAIRVAFALLALFFLLFIAPILIAIGSILITGRTM